MSDLRKVVLTAGAALLATGLGVAAWRAGRLEAAEVTRRSPWLELRAGAPSEPGQALVEAWLERGALATAEVCVLGELDPARWAGAVELSLRRERGDALVSLPLIEPVLAYATRSGDVSCLLLAYDEEVPDDGDHVIEAAWPEGQLPAALAGTPVRASLMARARLRALDRAVAFLVALGGLLALVGAVRWAPAGAEGAVRLESRGRAGLRAGAGAAALATVAVALATAPLQGARGDLARGVALALAQVAIGAALAWAAGRRLGVAVEGLGLTRPARAVWALWLSPIVGGGLWLAGDALSRLVPATGVAEIQTAVASPGGLLAVATIAAAAPIAEELFFRGFLWAALARALGAPGAFAITAVLFVAAHLDQAWGAWPAVCSLALTSLVLGALRWWTGSIAAPALAHLGHNVVILALSLSAPA